MSLWGMITGRSFATRTSGKKCKQILGEHGIQVHGLGLDRGRYLFWVKSRDAERAAQILEAKGINVGEWDD